MPQWREAEGPRHCHVRIGDAVDRQRREQTFLTAINGLESAIREMAVAVIDGIAAGVRRDQERFVPIAIEQRRQGMRLVMVVENYFRIVAKAAGPPEFVDLENIVNILGVISQKLLRHMTAGASLYIFAIFFPYPAHAADVSVKYGWKFAAAETGDIDVLACFPGNR